MEKQRVIIYIDGFNFYYGLKESQRWRRYYWIDVFKLFEQFMRDNQEIVEIKYFSAIPDNKDKSKNQSAFFQANQENPRFKVILGKYLKKKIRCFNCGNEIHTHEEKETDVRIATQLVADAYKNNCDVAILVSADSDMKPAIELVKETSTKVYVYFPPNHFSSDLANISGSPTSLYRYEKRFQNALLPDNIKLKNGYVLSIPEKWKGYRDGGNKKWGM